MKSRNLLIIAIWLGYLSRVLAIPQWPLTVTNIAELQSVNVSWVESAEWASTMPSSPAVYVLGYYKPGDRGGGMFEWDPNANNATDGGLYFVTNGWTSGNGRWVRRINGETVNVKMWGAVGDGVTDDAPAIQSAIYSLTNGGTLYFPSGVYRLDSTVNTGSEFYQNYALWLTNLNMTVRGDGPSSVLLQTDCRTTLLAAYFNTPAAGLTVENIKFQADTNNPYYSPSDSYASGKLLVCEGVGGASGYSKYLRIKNVCTDDQGKRNAFQIFAMDDVVVEGCRFVHFATTNGNQGIGFPTIWVTDEGLGSFHLINNFFDGGVTSTNPICGADGIVYQQNGEETVISGNTINNFKLEAIQCGAEKQTVSDNIFRASWHGAIPFSLSVLRTNAQVTILNNVQTGGGSFAGNGDAAWDTNTTMDLTIANNTVMLGNKDAGIGGLPAMAFWNLRRAVITGNIIDNYSDQAVIISGTGADDSSLLIQGNSFTSMAAMGPNGAGSQTGLHVGANFRNISILNNTISSGGNGPIVVDGTFNAPTNFPGRVVLGNNIYVGIDNKTPNKWVRVGNVTIQTATTNAGNYIVSDLNPGPF